jgi:hypothetical protein
VDAANCLEANAQRHHENASRFPTANCLVAMADAMADILYVLEDER